MVGSAAQPQSQQKLVFAQGRASSELPNIAPAEGGRPLKNSKKRDEPLQIETHL